ncbi:RNA polymerase sigma factor [Crateriforma conspicua]|uniref:RNA polymerase sigma factor n=1 Tax=Crateriforma conspicua TaxID=2527996 RepID=A0A5C5Y7E1_9PLAN|nr:sigma-70 family RNA polymerase sigma factor [Crateriforma conspicua]QDV65298.1 ECF RNA polymerase sigma factor SigW [Crateriforma conspicua]TWT70693.1 ECF RNA polymerase sigma factor SigW [Crateriforma conspicua]
MTDGVDNESDLITDALSGNRDAFATLVRRNQDRLFASMIQVTGSPDEAEEVVQEAFIRAFVKLDTFQQNSQFFTWLYRIAFNTALTRRRRQKVKISLDQARESAGHELTATTDAVDENLLRAERVTMIRVAMARLSEDHRSILVLREMEGHDYEKIAEILCISIGTVRSRLNRARRQLKQHLEQLEDEQTSRPQSRP